MPNDHENGQQMNDEKKYWLDEPRNIDRLFYAFCAVCLLFVAADLFVAKHGLFVIEHRFGFYSIIGFVSCAGIIWGAKQLRRALMRPEDYYDS